MKPAIIIILVILGLILMLDQDRNFPGTKDIKYTPEEMMEKRASQAEVEQ